MLRYRTLYLPWFVFYIQWKSVRLELLTSILHSLRNDMLDCHPEETLSTSAPPWSKILSEGRRSTMSYQKYRYS